jgi:hypothetical protein
MRIRPASYSACKVDFALHLTEWKVAAISSGTQSLLTLSSEL